MSVKDEGFDTMEVLDNIFVLCRDGSRINQQFGNRDKYPVWQNLSSCDLSQSNHCIAVC